MKINIGYLLADHSRQLRRAFNHKVRAMGITSAQARLLLMLEREPRNNQAYYAEQLEIEPITLCRMVDRMEDAGLVERCPDPNDRRARLLQLTSKSQEETGRIRCAVDELIETMWAGFDEAERNQFTHLLSRISDNLSNDEVERNGHG